MYEGHFELYRQYQNNAKMLLGFPQGLTKRQQMMDAWFYEK